MNDLAFGIALTDTTSTGKIVLGGVAQAGDPVSIVGVGGFGLARLTATGALDTTFGTAGKTTTKVTPLGDAARALRIQHDGRILAVGDSGEVSPFPLDPSTGVQTVIRYTAAGALDSTFGVGGVVTTPFSPGGASARGAAIDAGDRLVTTGTATTTKPNGTIGPDFTTVRYLLA